MFRESIDDSLGPVCHRRRPDAGRRFPHAAQDARPTDDADRRHDARHVSATARPRACPISRRSSAGVVTQAATAGTGAGRKTARAMATVLAALKARASQRARHPDLERLAQPQYRYAQNEPPVITGYQASNTGHGPLPRHREGGRDPRRAGRAKAPTRSTGPICRSTSPRPRSTRRGPMPWPRRARGPSSMPRRPGCGSIASCRSRKAARCRHRRGR